jgi:cholesterol 7alpha-monooxygenase
MGFWVIAYMAHNPEVLEVIQKEVTGAVTKYGLDESHLSEKCPALDSLLNETLRLTVTSPLGRVVTMPTAIGGKLLQKGKTVMVRHAYTITLS